MLHTIAHRVLESYLGEKKILSPDELGLTGTPYETSKDSVFVTLYRDGKIIASSGRVGPKKTSTALELIENTLYCLRDPRFAEAVKSPDELGSVKARVDLIGPNGRRVLKNLNDLDPKSEGLLLLSQTLNKLAILLPGISNVASTPEELFSIACKKTDIDPKTLKEEDYVLYAINTTVFSEF